MDIFGNLSLDLNLLVAIIGVSEFLKKLDKRDKYKRFYPFFPVLSGFVVSIFITSPMSILLYLKNAFIYAAISSLAYNVIKQTILGTKGVNMFDTKNKLGGIVNDEPKKKSGGLKLKVVAKGK